MHIHAWDLKNAKGEEGILRQTCNCGAVSFIADTYPVDSETEKRVEELNRNSAKEGNMTIEAPTNTADQFPPIPPKPANKSIVQHCRDNKGLFIAYLQKMGSVEASKLWGLSNSEIPRLKREFGLPVKSYPHSNKPRTVVSTTPEGGVVKRLKDITSEEKYRSIDKFFEAGIKATKDREFLEALKRTLAKARAEQAEAEKVYDQLTSEVEALEIIIKRLEVKR
jgi:hypothetical protein